MAPGHIWGDSLKWYFGYLARKRGVEMQQIYDETAAELTAVRARRDQAQFFDVSYADFTADPVGTVESAYAYFGLPFSAAAADAMRALHTRSTAGQAWPAHQYTLAEFGLTAAEVGERFGTLNHSGAELR